jgi:uncharacterized RmlC-like cupin family protein
MNPQTGSNEAMGKIQIVRPGPPEDSMPHGVLGADAISNQTTGSEGLFMSKYRVPPGAHSDLHLHTNCETAVYVLSGRAYAFVGEDLGDYIEAGPGDFVYIPANLAHVVGCPEGSEPLEYIVSRNAPEEVVVTLKDAGDLPIRPDGKMIQG